MKIKRAVLTLIALLPLASTASAFLLYPIFPQPVFILRPDLVITDIDACKDLLSDDIFIDVDVKNIGTRGINGNVRIDVYVEHEGILQHVTRTVSLQLGPGQEAEDIPVPAVSQYDLTNLEVTAVVDQPVGPYFLTQFQGVWAESNENNNDHFTIFYWVGDFCGYDEL